MIVKIENCNKPEENWYLSKHVLRILIIMIWTFKIINCGLYCSHIQLVVLYCLRLLVLVSTFKFYIKQIVWYFITCCEHILVPELFRVTFVLSIKHWEHSYLQSKKASLQTCPNCCFLWQSYPKPFCKCLKCHGESSGCVGVSHHWNSNYLLFAKNNLIICIRRQMTASIEHDSHDVDFINITVRTFCMPDLTQQLLLKRL